MSNVLCVKFNATTLQFMCFAQFMQQSCKFNLSRRDINLGNKIAFTYTINY